MGIENSETKEMSQNTPSFEEIRQKVIKLNNEEYKGKTYEVGMHYLGSFPYVGVKNEKMKLQLQNEKTLKKDFNNLKLGVSYTKMRKEDRERFELDKQEMLKLISDLGDLYGLNLPKGSLYVNEENGKVVISYYDSMAEGENTPFDDSTVVSEGNGNVNIVSDDTKPYIQIVCDGEKAVFQRDGKVEKEFKLRTPEEKKLSEDFNNMYSELLNEDNMEYTDGNGVNVSIEVGTINGENAITIIDGQTEYSLIMKDNGDFAKRIININGSEENITSPLSPEDVEKSLQNIQEKINEGKIINSQKATEKFDEAQKNEGDLAEEELDKALENM